MDRTIRWFQEVLSSMGNAVFHPYTNNSPPNIEPHGFTDDPYKNKGIA